MSAAIKAKLRSNEETVFVYRHHSGTETFVDCAGCELEYKLHDFYMDNHKIMEYSFEEKEFNDYLLNWKHKAVDIVNPTAVRK